MRLKNHLSKLYIKEYSMYYSPLFYWSLAAFLLLLPSLIIVREIYVKDSKFTSSFIRADKISVLFKKEPSQKKIEIAKIAISLALKYDIKPELVLAVIYVESKFNPKARSHVGAIGPMQIMPKTAKFLKIENPYDITQNIDGGIRYLKSLIKMFKGDVVLALAAYNAGPQAVINYNGIPPYKETKDYVNRIKKAYTKLKE